MYFVKIILVIVALISSLYFDDIYFSSVICFWVYLIVLSLDFLVEKKITLVSIFLLAFIYIILPEGILRSNSLYYGWGREDVNTGFRFLIVSSSFLFIGYTFYRSTTRVKRAKRENSCKVEVINNRRRLFVVLLVFSFLFFIINIQNTIHGLTTGRASATPYMFSQILYILAFIALGLWNEYFRENRIKAILYSFPIIITFIGTGTRFFLIYILFILFFRDLYTLNWKKTIRVVFLFFIVLFLISQMRKLRSIGLLNQKKIEILGSSNLTDITPYLASYGSVEGIIRNAAMITNYTRVHGNSYGRSIGFLFIFWVPRSVWPDKPVMLDSWLIRHYETEGFSKGHSTASGYGGELYMDFGFLGASLFLFFLGIGLAKIQNWIDENERGSVQNTILSGFLYGWLFFATRSLLTSTYFLIFMLLLYKLVFKNLHKFSILKFRKNE